ncbi:DEKNAAC103935 [Brettanomyces naardenensis]|uniref:DEKNAAC103935 n=1 Tax=Brettanomyces naardenensis TaxID=13370 RepID=A0A448YPH8_BRENA|nr:DEKNAAC103935 [Brettanomyces naardenensis]
MSYVVPDAENNTDLFQTMLNSLLSSPDTMMVLGGESKGKDGVDNEFLDTLDRVSLKELPKGSRCPICTNDFRSGEYPLVVRLPCDSRHCFDLECISPWLKMNRTCPLCREDVTEVRQKKLEGLVRKAKEEGGEEDEEEGWEMYG